MRASAARAFRRAMRKKCAQPPNVRHLTRDVAVHAYDLRVSETFRWRLSMTDPAAAFGKLRERCRSFISWRAMLLVAVAVMGLLQLTPWIGATSQSNPVMSANCEAWDREASEGIAALLPDRSA